MAIEAVSPSRFLNPQPVDYSARVRSSPPANDRSSSEASETSTSQLAGADINEKASALGQLHGAYEAAMALNGRLEDLLQPIR